MANATLNAAQVATLLSLRSFPDAASKPVRKALFESFKTQFGIPAKHMLRVNLDDVGSPLFGLLIRKKDSTAYPLNDQGKWTGTNGTVGGAPAPVVRWFALAGDLADHIGDLVADLDANDGQGAKPAGTALKIGNLDCVVTADGKVFVSFTA